MAGAGSTMDWRAQSGRLLGDLLNIEVDVVIDDAIDRPAAPTVVGAGVEPTIRELITMYRRWLDGAPADEPPGDLAAELRRIADDAAAADAAIGDEPDAGDVRRRVVLRRIGGNAAQLIGALSRGDAGAVDVARITRKAWELGTSEIVAQSVVQLDGDMAVRTDESFLGADMDPLRDLHRQALGAALSHWQTLFDFVAQLLIGATGLLSALWHGRRAALSSLRRWLDTRRRAEKPPTATLRNLLHGDERRRVVGAFRELRDELLAGGGSTVESTTGGATYARTVVQPDGDVLWFVSPRAVTDRTLLDAHMAAVLDWYERSGETVSTLQGYLTRAFALARAVLLAIGAVVVAVISVLGNPWFGLLSLLVAAVLVPLGAFAFRSLLGRLVRGGIGGASSRTQ